MLLTTFTCCPSDDGWCFGVRQLAEAKIHATKSRKHQIAPKVSLPKLSSKDSQAVPINYNFHLIKPVGV
jgi:hypothetical protein